MKSEDCLVKSEPVKVATFLSFSFTEVVFEPSVFKTTTFVPPKRHSCASKISISQIIRTREGSTIPTTNSDYWKASRKRVGHESRPEAALAYKAHHLYLDCILEIFQLLCRAYLVSSSHKLSCDTIILECLWEEGVKEVIGGYSFSFSPSVLP